MFTKNTIPIGIIGAAVYLTLLAIFSFNSHYLNIVLMYIGNILFFGVVLIGIIRLNKLADGKASSNLLFKNGLGSTIVGVLICTVVGVILFFMQKSAVPDAQVLNDFPAQAGDVEQDDMFLTIIVNTLIVNAILGVLATILGSGVVKANQKSSRGRESVQ